MKNNKTVWIAAAASLTIIFIISRLIGGKDVSLPKASSAVPINASVIAEIKNPKHIIYQIKKEETAKKISKLSFFQNFRTNLLLLDSLSDDYKFIRKLLNKRVIVSMHSVDGRKTDFLYLATVSEKKTNQLPSNIKSLMKKNGELTEITYDKALIFKMIPKHKNADAYFFTIYQNYFLISKSEILIEKSIRKINSKMPLDQEAGYNELYNKIDEDAEVKLFVNYDYLPATLSTLTQRKVSKRLKNLSHFAHLTALEFNPDGSDFQLSGYTITNKSNQYLDVFEKLPPASHKIRKYFPEKTAFYMIASVGNGLDFYQYYATYLTEIKDFNSFQQIIYTFKKDYNIKKKDNIYKYFEDEIAYVLEDKRKNGSEYNAYGILKLKDEDLFNEFMTALIVTKAKSTDKKPSDFKHICKVKDETYKYFTLPDEHFPTILFGQIFENLKPKYFFVNDGYVILTESANATESYIRHLDENKMLNYNDKLTDFLDDIPDEANLSLYVSPYNINSILTGLMTKTERKSFNKELSFWRKTSGIALQFISDAGPDYTNISFNYEAQKANEPESVWEINTDTLCTQKPYIVLNHNTEDREIVVQDDKNKLYLADKDGKLLWERQIDGKIISEIKQIDYYKNNKLQMIFNTKTEIHLIDRNGNYVEGYPVKLPGKASAGMALFDYDHNKKYRICIPMMNRSVLLYDKTGKKTEGWKFRKTKQIVRKKAKHFASEGKDYIVFTDDIKMYITDRQGNIRVSPVADFPISEQSQIYFEPASKYNKARFVTTNPNGVAYFTDIDGKVKKFTIKEFTNKHFFAYQDLNGDGLFEFIYADGRQLYAFNNRKEKIFTYTFGSTITSEPTFYKFSKQNIKIGVSCQDKQQIYLINNDGSKQKEFPLEGISPFSITQFAGEQTYSLIVNKKNNSLVKYELNIK